MIADEPAPVELPCATGMAFGHEYGSTKVNGRELLTRNSIKARSKREHAPFTDVEVGVSEKSRRVWSVVGTATFDTGEAARALIDNLVARFEATMPIVDKVPDPVRQTVTLYTGAEKQCLEVGGQERCYHSDGEKIELTYSEDRIDGFIVTLDCGDISMEKVAVAEALGRD